MYDLLFDGFADSDTSSTVASSTIWNIKVIKATAEAEINKKEIRRKKVCCHRELEGKRNIALSFPPWNDLL